MRLIAEIGSSPAPTWDFERWCDAARDAGATDVKAQCFLAAHFPESEQASKLPLEFPRARLPEFVAAAHVRGLGCGMSVFDAEAVELAARYCDWLKLASREIGNHELVKAAYRQGEKGIPIYRSIPERWKGPLRPQPYVTLLGVVPVYPARMIDSCWQAHSFARWFRINDVARWGWSSHTTGLLDCVLAARLGASVIEKHLAIDPNNIEASHSLSPHQFKRLAAAVLK